jgi:hypothetical protein
MHKALMVRADKHKLTPAQISQEGKHNMDILLRGIFTPEGFLELENKINKS